jgi:uncharacterized protein (DUF362 family)
MPFPEKIIGVYHFLTDIAPKNIPTVQPKPHKDNPWVKDGLAVVVKVKAASEVMIPVKKAIDLLGNIKQVVHPGDRVFIKPNFNSNDPPPGSTDLPFLQAVTEYLLDAGAQVTIGDSSGGYWRPTRNVYHKTGIDEMARRLGVTLISFEDKKKDWVIIPVSGDYLKKVTMPRSAYEADRMVYLPCVKTHLLAHYSGTLKLAFGFVHPGERRGYHMRHLEEKLAEISLCWQPDLVIMDGRKIFITGGPDRGQVAEPGVILASGDLTAIDIEAVKLLKSNGAFKKSDYSPENSRQIQTALKYNLGSAPGKYLISQSPV